LAVTSQAATATTIGSGADTGSGGSLDGSWTVASGSQAGYRVQEVLFGQDTEAVDRTSAVTRELTVSGSQMESGNLTVAVAALVVLSRRRPGRRFPLAMLRGTRREEPP
jgi:hypothetical protein